MVRYASLKDAAQKLSSISADQSTLLQFFALASAEHRGRRPCGRLPSSSRCRPYVPPGSLAAAPNQDYLGALKQLADLHRRDRRPARSRRRRDLQSLARRPRRAGPSNKWPPYFAPIPKATSKAIVQKLLDDPILYVEDSAAQPRSWPN